MKSNLLPPFLLGAMLSSGPLLADELPAVIPRVVGPIADGAPTTPVEKPPLPVAPVERTTVHHQGGRAIVMQKIQPPALPVPPLSVAAPDAALSIPLQQTSQIQPVESRPQLLLLSATVYGHQKTLLRWWHAGGEYVAWSTVDFNDLGGFGSYEAGGVQYGFHMALGNNPLADAPEGPVLPANGPTFVLVQGDSSNTEALAAVKGLHELYKVESARLIAARLERERNQAEREAYLRANPPQPKNTTTKFWKRPAAVVEGGGQ